MDIMRIRPRTGTASARSAAESTNSFVRQGPIDRLRFQGRNLQYRMLFSVLARHACGRVIDVGGGRFHEVATQHGVTFDQWLVVEPDAGSWTSGDDERVSVLTADGCALGLRDGSADTVLSIQVLEHVIEPIRMIEELYRVTAPGGTLIVMVPQTANLHHVPHHYQNLTRFWLDAMAARLGAEVVEYHALGGAWSTLASRLLLQHLAPLGVSGYSTEGRRRGWRFWVLFPVGVVLSAAVIPVALALSSADLVEEANNHLMVLRRPIAV